MQRPRRLRWKDQSVADGRTRLVAKQQIDGYISGYKGYQSWYNGRL